MAGKREEGWGSMGWDVRPLKIGPLGDVRESEGERRMGLGYLIYWPFFFLYY